MRFTFRKLKETLFGMQFVSVNPVMTDGAQNKASNPMQKLIILFVIDVLQVLRVMLSPKYGWNVTTYNTGKHVDIVYDITLLLGFIVPRYTFFGLAFLMVSFALGDAFYCLHLFKAGEINKIGPVKALRFMVAVVVTTLFSSVLKWLLIPLDCLISEEESFSSSFHGEGAPCTPWAFPEIIFTVPTIVIIVFYVLFALTAAFFSLATNPLSCEPHVQFTGRVEALFILTKVCATFLPFLADFIQPVAATAILFILCAMVLWWHLSRMPFHSLSTNMLRGGIYAAVLWLAFSSLLVAALSSLDALSDSNMQTLQWLLLATVPIAFPVGVFTVHRRRTLLLFSVDRLRGEFETQMVHQSSLTEPPSHGKTASRSHDMHHASEAVAALPWQDASDASVPRGVLQRGAYENFFDPSWERRRAFRKTNDAMIVVRTVLMHRNETELQFLRYLLVRALDEHPNNEELQVLNVSLLRFVFRSASESAQAEKRMKSDRKGLGLDHEYILYAFERKAAQDYAASSIGNGAYTAINLMEFDSGMQTARAAHLQCIVQLRKFWTDASNSKKAKETKVLQDAVDRLVDFDLSVTRANSEYQVLLDKYPQSVQLANAYCSFCDVVLNDAIKANELRRSVAALMEEEDSQAGSIAARQREQDLESKSQTSGASSNKSQDDGRTRLQKSFREWAHNIFGAETAAVQRVARQLRVCFVLLLVSSVAGFAVFQFWLFQSMAQRDAHLINQTGMLRAWSITAAFLSRTQMMAAHRGDAQGSQAVGATIAALASKLQGVHWDNFELVHTKKVQSFYQDEGTNPVSVNVPDGLGWHMQHLTFWAFGSDWARRMERASKATAAELQEEEWSNGAVGEAKLNLKFLHENAFRSAIPALDAVVLLYEEETKNLWVLTQQVVLGTMFASVSVLLVICLLVVFRLVRNIASIQHLYLACYLANTLPQATTRKICNFYKDAEQDMRNIDDEETAKRELENAPDPDAMDMEEAMDVDDGCGAAGVNLGDTSRFSRRPGLVIASGSRQPRDFVMWKRSTEDEDEEGREEEEEEEEEEEVLRLRRAVYVSRRPSLSLTAGNLELHHKATSLEDEPRPQPAAPGLRLRSQKELAGLIASGVASPLPNLRNDPAPPRPPCLRPFPHSADAVESPDAHAAALLGGPGASPEEVALGELHDDDGKSDSQHTVQPPAQEQRPSSPHGTAAGAQGEEEEAGEEEPEEAAGAGGEEAREREVGGEGSLGEEGAGRRESELRSEEDTIKSALKGRTKDGLDLPARDPVRFANLGSMTNVLQGAVANGSWRHKQMSFTKKQKSSHQHQEDGTLPLRSIPDEREDQIWQCVRKHERFSARTSVWLCSLVVIIGLSVLQNWFPTRRMETLVDLAPTINQAGRRRMLTRTCAHLARELVIDDGFSRSHRPDLAAALASNLAALKRANDAVRLGGDLGIAGGADHRNRRHNEIMYGSGCEWRLDPSDCSLPLRPGAASNGLQSLVLSFFDAVEAVLLRHGPPRAEWTDVFSKQPRPGDMDAFDRVVHNSSLVDARLRADPDLPFIVDSFSGDVFQGFALIVEMFDEELQNLVAQGMRDNEAIFIVLMLGTFGGVYLMLFGRAIKEALAEGEHARGFVAQLPAHVLSKMEKKTISEMFEEQPEIDA